MKIHVMSKISISAQEHGENVQTDFRFNNPLKRLDWLIQITESLQLLLSTYSLKYYIVKQ
jgi:hypothetical protein